ncbi:N-acetylmuramoyl-L-alanine amidase [Saccharopolyspora sp. K220]|uniref:peptidoglycan recognition protein family protein n=1 Tax=Saccharopolyspora soli TaxID=2926618 RepID=UPI001F574A1F|nr:N-acetylmuramoyl-L-alanine amidase [Saccharopolyspora soli]MCI2421518.1 N-acetylmuramoyl-L-alanine amidase [Saccharopolyspora soli]
MALPLIWLADVLRGTGLHVVETYGWRERTASGPQPRPVGVLEHHTATPTSYQRPAPTVQLCIDGRPDLDGPLCHGVIGYDGVIHLIAAGRANHAGKAKASGPNPAGDGNTLYVGFEWDYQGVDQGPSPEQYDAAVRATRAVLDHLGRPADAARGHKETSVTGKIDPGRVDMNLFRAAVASGEQDLDMATVNELFELVRRYSGGDSAYGYTIPRSPERVRRFAAAIPPKMGRVTGNDGELFVSLVAGENVEVREIYACEDWQADGKPGRKYGLQGPYTLVANDRQSFPVPGAATQVCVVYRSDCDLSLSVEIDAKWK